jgi:tight adherence protein B
MSVGAALAWTELAAALCLVGAPRGVAERAGRLAGAGRLADRPPARVIGVRVPARNLSGLAAPGVVAAVVAAVTVAGGVLLGVAAVAVVATVAAIVRDAVRHRRRVRDAADLGTALGLLVAELEAGARPSAALAAAREGGVAHRMIFERAAARAERGDDAAIELLAAAPTRVIGCAWRLGEQSGAPLAGVLARVAADVAAAADQRRASAVALAGPRSSAVMLAGLPILGLGLGSAMGAAPVPFLITTGAGRVLCCVGVLLDVAGIAWMRRILRRAAEP